MLLTKSNSERSNQKSKKRCRKLANEVEKTAVRELLNSVNVIRSKTEELYRIQNEQNMIVHYLQGVMDASDCVDKGV